MICPACKTEIGDGWCRDCDAESDRLNQPVADDGSTDRLCAEVVQTAALTDATGEERTPLPEEGATFVAVDFGSQDQTAAWGDVGATLAYLYAEAGIRADMLGATDEERLAHNAVRQDIRGLARHYGLELRWGDE